MIPKLHIKHYALGILLLAVLFGCTTEAERRQMRALLDRADSMNRAYIPMTDGIDSLLMDATHYYDRHGNANQQMRAYYLLGCAYRDMGEAPAALQSYQDAVDHADTLSSDCDYRRQVNIESLNVSASSIEGVHKYTITAWSNEDQIQKITRQIEKKIDVIKANYFTDEQLFIRESGLYKLSTQKVLENPDISRTIRRHEASIMEVNPTYTVVMKNGKTEDILNLYEALNAFDCVFQYTRSGRIAVTRAKQEQVSQFLEERENHGPLTMNNEQ